MKSLGPSRGHSFCEADRVYGVMRHSLDGKQLVSMPETMKHMERNLRSSIGAYSIIKKRVYRIGGCTFLAHPTHVVHYLMILDTPLI